MATGNPQDRRKKTTPIKATAPAEGYRPTSAANWKGRAKIDGTDVLLPSGNVAKCIRPGLPEMLGDGTFPDEVMTIIRGEISSAESGGRSKKQRQQELEKMFEKPEEMDKLLDAFDRVTVRVVLEPKVLYHSTLNEETGKYELIPAEDRDEDTLYVDEVDFQDKSFLFQWAVGGSGDLARFRKQQKSGLDNA